LSNYAWTRGAHLTAEQLAYHALLERMGYVDHHQPVPTAQPVADAFLAISDSPLVHAPLAIPFMPNMLLALVAAGLLWSAWLLSGRLVPQPYVLSPRGITPEPPDQPPRRAA
jgi:hypothetical protein